MNEKAPPTKGNPAKAIIRGVVAVLAIIAIAVAVMDFMAKGQFEASSQAAADRLDKDGFPVSAIPEIITGSPTVIGDPEKDDEIIYRWGMIRDYDLTIMTAGSDDGRFVTAVR